MDFPVILATLTEEFTSAQLPDMSRMDTMSWRRWYRRKTISHFCHTKVQMWVIEGHVHLHMVSINWTWGHNNKTRLCRNSSAEDPGSAPTTTWGFTTDCNSRSMGCDAFFIHTCGQNSSSGHLHTRKNKLKTLKNKGMKKGHEVGRELGCRH